LLAASLSANLKSSDAVQDQASDHPSPAEAVYLNLAFLSVYDDGQAYTGREHRDWLTEAGFADIDVRYSAGPGGASIVSARKG
jgi:hypothetical protein